MSLMDLLPKKSEADHLASAVDRLEAEHSAAQAQVVEARRLWQAALVNEAQGLVDDGPGAEDLQAHLSLARHAAERAAAALEAARVRLKFIKGMSAEAAESDRWDRAVSLAEVRNEVVARLAQSMAAFVSDYGELFNATTELSRALPCQPDPDGAMLHRDLVEIAVRKELVRLGLPWALPGAASLQLEPIARRFEGIPDKIHQWGAAALAKR